MNNEMNYSQQVSQVVTNKSEAKKFHKEIFRRCFLISGLSGSIISFVVVYLLSLFEREGVYFLVDTIYVICAPFIYLFVTLFSFLLFSLIGFILIPVVSLFIFILIVVFLRIITRKKPLIFWIFVIIQLTAIGLLFFFLKDTGDAIFLVIGFYFAFGFFGFIGALLNKIIIRKKPSISRIITSWIIFVILVLIFTFSFVGAFMGLATVYG